MRRRGFLGLFAGAITGATLDPERALWISGAKTISIPRPTMADFKRDVAAVLDVPETFFGNVSTQNYANFANRAPLNVVSLQAAIDDLAKMSGFGMRLTLPSGLLTFERRG